MGNCISAPMKKSENAHRSSQETLGTKRPPPLLETPIGGGVAVTNFNDSAKSLLTSDELVPDYDYEIQKLLGKGAGGETYLCRDARTNEKLAVKLIKRPIPVVASQTISREVNIQAQLGEGHLNIVTPIETILTDSHLGLVMEYVAGGNLTHYVMERFDSVHERGGLCLTEDEARYFFRQIVSVVEYCHCHRVAHRDLKLDNTLITSDRPPVIKICDFGFARCWAEDPSMTTITGTPDYMAPQLTGSRKGSKNKYDGTKADIWAAGVLLCVMLLGKFPFDGNQVSQQGLSETMARVHQQQKTMIKWDAVPNLVEDADLLSMDCRDLLDKLLTFDESQRITIDAIKLHPWVTAPLPEEFQTALDALTERQRQMDLKSELGHYTSSARDAAVRKLVTQAAYSKPGASVPASQLKRLRSERRVPLLGVYLSAPSEADTVTDTMTDTSGFATPQLGPTGSVTAAGQHRGTKPLQVSRELSLKLEQVALQLDHTRPLDQGSPRRALQQQDISFKFRPLEIEESVLEHPTASGRSTSAGSTSTNASVASPRSTDVKIMVGGLLDKAGDAEASSSQDVQLIAAAVDRGIGPPAFSTDRAALTRETPNLRGEKLSLNMGSTMLNMGGQHSLTSSSRLSRETPKLPAPSSVTSVTPQVLSEASAASMQPGVLAIMCAAADLKGSTGPLHAALGTPADGAELPAARVESHRLGESLDGTQHGPSSVPSYAALDSLIATLDESSSARPEQQQQQHPQVEPTTAGGTEHTAQLKLEQAVWQALGRGSAGTSAAAYQQAPISGQVVAAAQ